MAKKIAMGIMATIIVVFFGLSAYKNFFGQEKEPEKPKIDIFKTAMENVDVSYVPYGESNGDCLLFVTNNNKSMSQEQLSKKMKTECMMKIKMMKSI